MHHSVIYNNVLHLKQIIILQQGCDPTFHLLNQLQNNQKTNALRQPELESFKIFQESWQ